MNEYEDQDLDGAENLTEDRSVEEIAERTESADSASSDDQVSDLTATRPLFTGAPENHGTMRPPSQIFARSTSHNYADPRPRPSIAYDPLSDAG